MKTSTELDSIAKLIGEERAVEAVAKAGFDAWDFSLFEMVKYDWKNKCALTSDHPLAGREYLAFARKLKQVGLDNGIVCNQSHAPFPVSAPAIRDSLKRAIECTAEAGGNICIVHPDNNKTAEENLEMYVELCEFGKGCKVKIATENMWNWDKEKNQCAFAACMSPESFIKHVDIVGSEYMTACLDIGHAEMKGSGTSAVELVKALGHRVGALHIHDTDRWHDDHQIPGSMQIDFAPIVKALKEIGYSGYFTLEACCYLSAYTKENAFEGVKKLADSARWLADMFENM